MGRMKLNMQQQQQQRITCHTFLQRKNKKQKSNSWRSSSTTAASTTRRGRSSTFATSPEAKIEARRPFSRRRRRFEPLHVLPGHSSNRFVPWQFVADVFLVIALLLRQLDYKPVKRDASGTPLPQPPHPLDHSFSLGHFKQIVFDVQHTVINCYTFPTASSRFDFLLDFKVFSRSQVRPLNFWAVLAAQPSITGTTSSMSLSVMREKK